MPSVDPKDLNSNQQTPLLLSAAKATELPSVDIPELTCL